MFSVVSRPGRRLWAARARPKLLPFENMIPVQSIPRPYGPCDDLEHLGMWEVRGQAGGSGPMYCLIAMIFYLLRTSIERESLNSQDGTRFE